MLKEVSGDSLRPHKDQCSNPCCQNILTMLSYSKQSYIYTISYIYHQLIMFVYGNNTALIKLFVEQHLTVCNKTVAGSCKQVYQWLHMANTTRHSRKAISWCATSRLPTALRKSLNALTARTTSFCCDCSYCWACIWA